MSAPHLSQPLVLERADTAPDGAGGWSQVWVALGTLWAEVSARSGRETTGELGAVSTATYRITVRAAPHGQSNRPVPGQRFRLGARVWTIEAVAEADVQGRYLTCFATEEMAA